VPGTSYQPLYLDAGAGALTRDRPAAAATVSYDSERAGRERGRATFDLRFDTAAEVVGGMKLRIWMSAPDAQDMDVFVAVQKLDAYGDLTGFPFYAVFEDGPVALGWLRARALSSRWRSRSCRRGRCSGRARRCGSSSRAGTSTVTRGR
jgi:uncharacterized protein